MGPSVERELVVDAGREQVWRAVADAARLGEWLGAEVDLDLRPGGAASFRFDDGEARRGVVVQVAPGRSLTFTWWPVDEHLGSQSTVTISLDALDEVRTRLRIRETPATRARAAA